MYAVLLPPLHLIGGLAGLVFAVLLVLGHAASGTRFSELTACRCRRTDAAWPSAYSKTGHVPETRAAAKAVAE
jgi:hypothetical protein